MRSFKTLSIATLTAFLIAVPFAGAYAAGHHKGALDEATPTVFSGPRVTGLIDQIQGVDEGIADARQENTITPAEAQRLHMRAAHISQPAERVATTDHGRIPAAQYQLLRRSIISTKRCCSTPATASTSATTPMAEIQTADHIEKGLPGASGLLPRGRLFHDSAARPFVTRNGGCSTFESAHEPFRR
ncbi:hypothetical protein [Mesorhizobium sp. M00.F.Ca.ET.216.01.1.1]|uniref:hypothetical protein n=1 Tax=Mesorhizobium sp. M00.F.Ca.ET.216.01.1.1 TaxID=2500528 RepID=UPI0026C4308C